MRSLFLMFVTAVCFLFLLKKHHFLDPFITFPGRLRVNTLLLPFVPFSAAKLPPDPETSAVAPKANNTIKKANCIVRNLKKDKKKKKESSMSFLKKQHNPRLGQSQHSAIHRFLMELNLVDPHVGFALLM